MPSKMKLFFGLGEQYSYLNLKNKKVPIFCQEQGIGRGKNLFTFLVNLLYKAGGNQFTTYFPQPSFISTKSYFFIANCFDYSIFDFKRKKLLLNFILYLRQLLLELQKFCFYSCYKNKIT